MIPRPRQVHPLAVDFEERLIDMPPRANPECRKVVSTEYPFSEGFVTEDAGGRRIVSACRACVDLGWRPPGHRGF
jgi:hypothetical protein